MTLFRGGIFPRLIALFPLIFPLYLLKGEVFGLPVTFPEVVLFFAVLYFAIREELWKIGWWRKNKSLILNWPVILFLCAGILSVMIVPHIGTFLDGREISSQVKAFGILKGWIFAPILYFYILKYYVYQKPSLIDLTLKSLLLGGVFLSLFALYQVWVGDYITMDMRASGPFESGNYLALYLGPLVVYSFFSLFRTKHNVERLLMLLGFVLCMAALFYTKSFAAWISVFVIFFVGLGLFVSLKKFYTKAIVVGVLLLGVVMFFISQIGTEKFDHFLDFSQRSSSSVRIQVYDVALGLIKQHPLLGIGLGQFELEYQNNATDILGKTPFEWVMIHPHNIFLAMWLNMGILGLICFIFMVAKALFWLFENDKRGRRIVALMLFAIVIHGIFDTPVFKNDLAFEFWTLLALLI